MNSQVTLAEKIEYLLRAESFPDGSARIELVETHFACLFLTRRFVYKLKKPIHFHEIDFTNLETRRITCELEVALNRRLAEPVYIGVVPLLGTSRGLALERDTDGEPVDWLVKMHRLPRGHMLDALAIAGRVETAQLRRLLVKLAAFYSSTTRAPWNGRDYRRHLERGLEADRDELLAPKLGIDAGAVRDIVSRQLAFLAANAATVEARCTDGHVVDAHGDLRPEHILLGDEPQIIDCLEFSAELRLLDTAEEIAFLVLECAALGRPELGAEVFALYREVCADAVPEPLFRFYLSRRALIRAMLCAWHMEPGTPDDTKSHWRERAHWYLEAARGDRGQFT